MSTKTLEIARSAMTTTRTALEVAAQNVANSQTPGYVRQRVSLAPVGGAQTAGRVGVGSGVTVQTIQRLRDQCLEAQINHQEGELGREASRSGSLSRVEASFTDLSGTGLSAALGDFFDSLQSLQTTPTSVAARDEVIYAAESFATKTNGVSGQLAQEQATLGSELSDTVTQANQLLHEVGTLNAKIIPLGDSPAASDLKVTREQTIRQLAGLCGALGLDLPNGGQDVLLGGLRVVQGSEVTELSLAPSPGDPSQQVVLVGQVEATELGGKLAGCLTTRDDVAAWQQSLDSLATDFANACNAVHRQGFDLNGQAGGDLFTYDAAAPADSLRVTEALRNQPELLAMASGSDHAAGDAGNAQALLSLRGKATCAGGTATAEEAYQQLLSSVGRQSGHATEAREARQSLLDSLDTQYANEAGVSLDDEAVDIMRYQQVYTASTRLVKVANDMLQEIVGLLD